MWSCLGWITAALLLGYLLGAKAFRRPVTLRTRCARIAVFCGRSYAELMTLLGGPAQEIMPLPEGRLLRTWRQGGFVITLCFDEKDACLGVYDERG